MRLMRHTAQSNRWWLAAGLALAGALAGRAAASELEVLQDLTVGRMAKSPAGGLGRFQNLLKYSEAFEDATSGTTWTETNVTVSANSATAAPDGSTTADQLTCPNAGAVDSTQQDSGTASTATAWTFSVWLRSVSGTTTIVLKIEDADENNTTVVTGLSTTSWQRYSVTKTFASAGGNVKVTLLENAASDNPVLLAWGAQLESGIGAPGVYVRTTSQPIATTATGLVAGQAAYVGGDLSLAAQGDARFLEAAANGTNFVAFQAPASIGSDVTWTLPADNGSGTPFLQNDGSGTLTWAAPSGTGDIGTFGDCTSGDCFEPNNTGTENTIYFEGDVDDTKEVALTAANPSGDVTVTLPTSSITLIGTDTTDTLSNKTLTTPRLVDLGYLADDAGNELLIFDKVASAVNELTMTNAATGNAPILSATGTDTNISIVLTPKGTGSVLLSEANPAFVFDVANAGDTDFWLGAIEPGLFKIGDGTTPGTNPAITVDSSGYVGVGTTAPASHLLHLSSTGSSDSTMLFQTSTTWAMGNNPTSTGVVKIANNATLGTNDRLFLGSTGLGVGVSPSSTLDVDGAMAIQPPSTVSLTADNQVVTVGDNSYIRLSSNDATATNRSFCLSEVSPVTQGQLLVLELTSNAAELRDATASGCASGDAPLLASTYAFGANDTMVLIYNGSNWVELERGNN